MREEIKKWLNEQHPWLQEAARRILIKGHLDGSDINDLVTIIKSPTPQGVKRVDDYPKIERLDAPNNVIRLVSIDKVQGIEKLAPRNPLEFGRENLCVIYGNNGSGKSGYVRILKKACGKPGANELKPNVFKTPPKQQSCTIAYGINGKEISIQWHANDEPIQDLGALDIFDNFSTHTYIDNESDTSYVPTELVFFSDLVNACKSIEKILRDEQNLLVKKLPDMPAKFANTEPWKIYTTLCLTSKLNSILPWTDNDTKKLNDLNERLKTDDPNTAAKTRRRVKEQIDKLTSTIKNALLKISEDACENIIKLRRISIEKRNAANEGAKVLSATAELEGIGSETWRALWFAARNYSTSTAYNGKPFPNIEENARCVLCHQQLDKDARNRLNAFNTYVTGKLQSEANAAEVELKNALIALPTIPDVETLKIACQAAELSDEIYNEILTIWEKVQKIITVLQTAIAISEIKKATIIPHVTASSPGTDVITILAELSLENGAKAQQYENDAKTFDRIKANADVLELQAKEWTAQQVAAISAELARLKQTHEYDQWKRLTDTTLISRKSGELSKALITDAYIYRFKQELQKLGAKNISVELVKTRTDYACTKHQVRLKGLVQTKTKAHEVLSEGEKRVISLAAFLADITGKSTLAPIIFDDPISSLDQIYEEKTIDRLIELSHNRQVLIFTHRLSFLGIINDKATPNTINIRCESWGTGEPGEVPIYGKKPDGALKNLKNNRLPKAKKTLDDEGNDAYYPLAKSLCTDIRIIMERIVETILLADVVQRHRREVHTKDKIHHLCKITKNDCDLVDEIMTKYSRYEHSQSNEAPVELPKPDELIEDIDKILVWHDAFKGRKT